MKHMRNLLCAALVAVALAPMPAYADLISPDYDDDTWTRGEKGGYPLDDEYEPVEPSGELQEDWLPPTGELESKRSGCSNAAVEAHAGAQGASNVGLAVAVGCLSLSATAGIVRLAGKRSR